MDKTLSLLIYLAKHKNGATHLTEAQQAGIASFLYKGTRQSTRATLDRRLAMPLSLWKDYGIYSRITLTDEGAEYCCGQSWNDEMRTLRECMLKF